MNTEIKNYTKRRKIHAVIITAALIVIIVVIINVIIAVPHIHTYEEYLLSYDYDTPYQSGISVQPDSFCLIKDYVKHSIDGQWNASNTSCDFLVSGPAITHSIR